jgi:hypothetical protein
MINKIQQTNRQDNLKPGVFENNFVRIQDLHKVIDEANADIAAAIVDAEDGVFEGPLQVNHVDVSIANATATINGNFLSTGYITSTSAAPTNITLPTATDLAGAIGATAGTVFDFIVDNSAGASTVTLVLNTGITVITPVITGGATLTISTANAVGLFRLVFTSATAAKLFRIG